MKRLVGVCGTLLLCGCPMAPEEQNAGPTAAAPIPADADPRNSCQFAFDDECDDGRPGASTSFCETFTDEADCLKTTADNPDNPVPEVVEVPVFVEVPAEEPMTNTGIGSNARTVCRNVGYTDAAVDTIFAFARVDREAGFTELHENISLQASCRGDVPGVGG